jgi:small subunit ribosomal protein S16
MAVALRLTRLGANKRPCYRLVVCDSRKPREGAIIESLGQYQPRSAKEQIVFNKERVIFWLCRGAVPSENVYVLLKKSGILTEWRAAKKPADKKKKAAAGATKA